MDIHTLLSPAGQWWWVLPVLVFAARVVDVSLGTLRVVFVSRGMKLLAPIVGFFEVLIWIAAVAQVVRSIDNNFVCFLAYAAGFGLGTFVGLAIEQRLAFGTLIVRVITQQGAGELIAELRRLNVGVTCVDAQGAMGPVQILFSVVRRADLPIVLQTVARFNPKAFYTVEDVRGISRQAFPAVAKKG